MKRIFCFMLVISMIAVFTETSFSMSRTMKEEPAIVIVTFGTTTNAQATFDFFDKQLRKELPNKYQRLKIEWAFTSEIVRERANKKFREAGSKTRYRSLSQVLSNLQDEGYSKIALQSLHIFPGQEYNEMTKVISSFIHMGMRIVYGGALFHSWEQMFEVIDILEKEFLSSKEGCNVLVAHGTPLSFVASNITYLGLDRYLNMKYSNVFVGSVDGVLTADQVLSQAKACSGKRVRFVPMMYVAGDHIMNDIMGNDPKEPSWSMEMKKAGFKVEAVYEKYKGKRLFKGLGFYKRVNTILIDHLVESLNHLEGKTKED